eukprot:4947133-Pyramimonas_sp.AAC.1
MLNKSAAPCNAAVYNATQCKTKQQRATQRIATQRSRNDFATDAVCSPAGLPVGLLGRLAELRGAAPGCQSYVVPCFGPSAVVAVYAGPWRVVLREPRSSR